MKNEMRPENETLLSVYPVPRTEGTTCPPCEPLLRGFKRYNAQEFVVSVNRKAGTLEFHLAVRGAFVRR
jgi:hypothetical protein